MNNKYFIEYMKEVNTLEPLPKVKVMKLKVMMKRQIEEVIWLIIWASFVVFTLWAVIGEIIMKWRLV
jgi:hypothetical protein